MELGSNSPLIVMDDADIGKAAEAIVATGYANAGPICHRLSGAICGVITRRFRS